MAQICCCAIYELRADVLMHHLCTSHSLICMHILQTTQLDSCGA